MAKKRVEKFIQEGIERPGALRAYAKAHGGIGADGNVKRDWALGLQRKLRKMKNRSKGDTRLLRQVNMFLGVLSKGRK